MSLKTVEIKGKPYVTVNVRIKEFRDRYGDKGQIQTTMVSNDGDFGKRTCIFKASVIMDQKIISTGHAYEDESAGYINKTSYIENCETSAIGRALAVLGIGIDESVASADEVSVAQQKQSKPSRPKKNPKINELWEEGCQYIMKNYEGIDYNGIKRKFLEYVNECGYEREDVIDDVPKLTGVVKYIKEKESK
jgi:hypothetical protein